MVKSRDEVHQLVQSYINEVNKVFFVKSAMLYGSYATGKATSSSDIDIAIVSSYFNSIPYHILSKILYRLAATVSTLIEPLALSEEEFTNPTLGHISVEIQKEGIPFTPAPLKIEY